MAKLLVVEDDQAMSLNLKAWLTAEHHTVEVVSKGEQALELLAAYPFELILLDWQLPSISGIEVVQQYRRSGGTTPILMLTGRDDVDAKSLGLESGADDYLTKPFHFKELIARIRALLRRPPQIKAEVLVAKNITLDTVSRRVLKDGAPVVLQPMEFNVLEFLMRHPRQLFSPEELLRSIWDSEADVSLDAIYTCIRRTRRKLGSEGEDSIIRNVHGIGYGLND